MFVDHFRLLDRDWRIMIRVLGMKWDPGKLTQAILGSGWSTRKSLPLCQVGNSQPMYVCSLLHGNVKTCPKNLKLEEEAGLTISVQGTLCLIQASLASGSLPPDKMKTCTLNLKFDKEDEVNFSISGPQSIHPFGFFSGEYEEPMRDAYKSDLYGEDISASESDDSSDYDSEERFGDDSPDDDEDMYPSSPVRNSGVVIEALVDDDKCATDNEASKEGRTRNQLSASAKNNLERQLVVKRSYGPEVLELEDGLPLRSTEVKDKSNEKMKKKQAKDEGSIRNPKGKMEDVVGEKEEKRESGQQPAPSSSDAVERTDMKQREKRKKQKKGKTNNQKALQLGDEGQRKQFTDKSVSIDVNPAAEDKKKNRKNKKRTKEAEATTGQAAANRKEFSQGESKSKSQGTFPNGLVIEAVMGKLDRKKASPPKKVSVHYTGKLKKNGEISDSNLGKAPFKFRPGAGQVIKGWNVGIDDMHKGDKRGNTIPPAMGLQLYTKLHLAVKGLNFMSSLQRQLQGPLKPLSWFDSSSVDHQCYGICC